MTDTSVLTPEQLQLMQQYTQQAGISDFDTLVTEVSAAVTKAQYEWQQLGVVYNPNITNLASNNLDWDNHLNQGEQAAFRIDFKVFPSQFKGWVAQHVDGVLKSRGVDIWQPTEWDGNALCIYFRVGFAPLLILGIILAAVVVVAIIVASVSFFKLKKIQVVAETQRAQATNDASIARQTQTYDKTMATVDKLTDPEDQLDYLLGIIKQEQSYQLSAEKQAGKESSSLTDLIKTPLTSFAVIAGLALLVVAVLFGLKGR